MKDNKKILNLVFIFESLVVIIYLLFVFISCYFIKDNLFLNIIIISLTLIFVFICIYLLKLEIKTGFYECKSCRHKFVPKYLEAVYAPHMLTSRYLKCPECGKKTMAKKVYK